MQFLCLTIIGNWRIENGTKRTAEIKDARKMLTHSVTQNKYSHL